jgi:protein-tyrosine phosphatase
VSTNPPRIGASSGRSFVLPDPVAGQPYRIAFVCTGNICRSPMAEVITRTMAAATELADRTALGAHLDVRSAGTGPWHEGEDMHPLAAAALARAGYRDFRHVAHQFKRSEIAATDLLVALDRRHLQTLRGLGADPGRSVLLRAFDPRAGTGVDVPDPYYGDDDCFDECREMIAGSCTGLVSALATRWDALGVA